MQKEFAKKVRNRREALGLSLEDLGHRVGVHATYIERIENGVRIPKPEVARRLAQALEESEEGFVQWSQMRAEGEPTSLEAAYARYPEAREALVGLCEDPERARQLFSMSAMGPLEAALYGLLIDRMSHRMADMGFWGFLPPKEHERSSPTHGHLLLEAFFEMLTHPEGETADYTNVFSGMLKAWRYGPPHRIIVTYPDDSVTTYRLSLVDQEGSIIPALEPEDPFYALYRMMNENQRADLAEICNIMLRRDERLEIQAALPALMRWHRKD